MEIKVKAPASRQPSGVDYHIQSTRVHWAEPGHANPSASASTDPSTGRVNGGGQFVAETSPFYLGLVGHWRAFGPHYRDWHVHAGERYRDYRFHGHRR